MPGQVLVNSYRSLTTLNITQMISDKPPMPSKLSALILQGNNGITQLRGDRRNHAREATSPSGGRRTSLRFRLTTLEW